VCGIAGCYQQANGPDLTDITTSGSRIAGRTRPGPGAMRTTGWRCTSATGAYL
jgi:hypothetical protein